MRHRTWAYLAAAWAIAFAAPHVYWATGRTAGLGTALGSATLDNAGWGLQLLNGGIAVFSLCGAATALATLRTWPVRWRRPARRGLAALAWFGACLLLARSIDIYIEFNLATTGILHVPAEDHDNYLHLARWFIFFWLPWFALGALAWTRLAWTFSRMGRRPTTRAASGGAPACVRAVR
jgi:Protein of unknown function (DUF3995)